MKTFARFRSTIAMALFVASLGLTLGLTGCGDDEGGCPGVLIPSCTSTYLSQCPQCSAGDDGWCVGYGFGDQRCCGCGAPPD